MTTSPLPEPAVIIGLGEMGGVFARAMLRTGRPVYPVTRTIPAPAVARVVPEPAVALVAVAESDVDAVLASLPSVWHSAAALLQNELLPRDWIRHGITDPTVIVVWFEKKPGGDVTVIIPSPVAGPRRRTVAAGLEAIGIPVRPVEGGDELVFELVRKNLYILTANIAGLETGGTVGELWDDHRSLAEEVAAEILAVQESLVGAPLEARPLMAGMIEAFEADPDHKTTGRSAPARLARALQHAAHAGIPTPRLGEIARSAGLPA